MAVEDGTGGGSYLPGTPVSIEANPPAQGKVFDKWTTSNGGSFANANSTSTTFTMPSGAVTVTATYKDAPVGTYTVTVNGSYAGSTGAGIYAKDAIVSLYAGNLSNYSFNGWTSSDVTITDPGNKNASFIMPEKNVTVSANWIYIGGGSGSGSGTPTTPSYKADVKAGSGAEMTLPVTVDKDTGTASIDTGSQGLDQGGTNITIPSIPHVDTYSVGIPVPDLSKTDVQGELTLNTDAGSITVPSNMLTGVADADGNKAQITIGQGDKSNLPKDVKDAIGHRPLVQLTLSIDGRQIDWINPNAPVTVSIPYKPTAQELANPEYINVWYIDGGGNVVSVPNGRYDPATGTVIFNATHFSHYAVAYVHKTFSDLGIVEWARKPIEVMASKGIINGTGKDMFSPTVNITRADYLVLLIKTLELTAEFDENFNDAELGSYYYEALGIAKKLGIAVGSGGNSFNPRESISRQDMMVLTVRALEKFKELEPANTNIPLDKYSDKGDIAGYAVNSLATLVKEGLIIGSGNKLNPRAYTTRAEAAVFLYKIYNK
ncbi:MAG: S-layer homology domain-containing protein [Desulfitobacteriaceae bacterium]|nr:S-layer homology domain-containing protein [Desulfitobacteriaceae bacterium]